MLNLIPQDDDTDVLFDASVGITVVSYLALVLAEWHGGRLPFEGVWTVVFVILGTIVAFPLILIAMYFNYGALCLCWKLGVGINNRLEAYDRPRQRPPPTPGPDDGR